MPGCAWLTSLPTVTSRQHSAHPRVPDGPDPGFLRRRASRGARTRAPEAGRKAPQGARNSEICGIVSKSVTKARDGLQPAKENRMILRFALLTSGAVGSLCHRFGHRRPSSPLPALSVSWSGAYFGADEPFCLYPGPRRAPDGAAGPRGRRPAGGAPGPDRAAVLLLPGTGDPGGGAVNCSLAVGRFLEWSVDTTPVGILCGPEENSVSSSC